MNQINQDLSIPQAVKLLQQGAIVAYPTEAVYGLGCDPNNHQALQNLMSLKHRDENKGVILIASKIEQLEFYVDTALYPEALHMARTRNFAADGVTVSVDNFTTWLLPINPKTINKIDPLIYGKFDTIAIRVTEHPIVVELCNLFSGPIVSTSANISGQAAIKDKNRLYQLVNENKLISGVVAGELGGYDKPSRIINAVTGELIR